MNITREIVELAQRAALNPDPPGTRYNITATARDGTKQYLSPTGRWVVPKRLPLGPLVAGTWEAQEAAAMLVAAQVPFGHVRGLERALVDGLLAPSVAP